MTSELQHHLSSRRVRGRALPVLGLLGALAAASLGAGCSGGGGSGTTVPPVQPPAKFLPTFADLDYTPATVARNPYQSVHVFLPVSAPPAGGYPVLLFALLGGHASSMPSTEVTPTQRLLYGALSSGIAVATCGITGSDDASIPGHGTFDPPGETAPGQDHYDQDAFAMCYKDAVWIVQYLRANSATYGLDPDRFYCMGRSGSATAWAWAALGEDRADPSATDFRTASSRVQGAILQAAQLWFPAFLLDGPTLGRVFPDKNDPVDTAADTLLDTFSEYPKLGSALYYGFNDAAVQAQNKQTAFFLYAEGGGGVSSTEFSLTAEAFPVPTLTNQLGIDNVHDPWFEYMLYQRLLDLDQAFGSTFHATNSELVVGPGAALGTIETGVLVDPNDPDELPDAELVWLLQQIQSAVAPAVQAAPPVELDAGPWLLLDDAGEVEEQGLFVRPR